MKEMKERSNEIIAKMNQIRLRAITLKGAKYRNIRKINKFIPPYFFPFWVHQ